MHCIFLTTLTIKQMCALWVCQTYGMNIQLFCPSVCLQRSLTVDRDVTCLQWIWVFFSATSRSDGSSSHSDEIKQHEIWVHFYKLNSRKFKALHICDGCIQVCKKCSEHVCVVTLWSVTCCHCMKQGWVTTSQQRISVPFYAFILPTLHNRNSCII